MRKIDRPAGPSELTSNAAVWTSRWVSKVGTRSAFSWPANIRALLVKVLREMSAGHCHFCDAFPIEAVTNEPIEHFKPKSECRDLAYEWTNLYYICEFCNSSKRERWKERMVAPDAHDYSFIRYFQFDFTTGAMEPSDVASTEDREAAANTIELYDLDNQARRRWRMLAARDWQLLCLHKPIDDHAYRDFVEQSME